MEIKREREERRELKRERERERMMVRGLGEKKNNKKTTTSQQTPEVAVASGDAQHAGLMVLLILPRHPGCFLS